MARDNQLIPQKTKIEESNPIGHVCCRSCVYLVVLLALLWPASCSRPSTGAGDAAPFDEPVANQVNVHQEQQPQRVKGEHVHAATQDGADPLQAVLVSSELIVGANRFTVGLFDAQGTMIHDATVHFTYFYLAAAAPEQVEAEADAYAVHTPDGYTTVYAHERSFEQAGQWGVEIQILRPEQAKSLLRIRFEVLPTSQALAVGEVAPYISTPVLADGGNDVSHLTSAPSPNLAFYQLSLDQALANGKATVLLFATPAFCQTRFCGPDYEIISGLQTRYGEAINFIHIEIYTGLPNPAGNNWEIAPAMAAFGLTTEPWVYILDQSGRVTYRVEGMFSADEIERHLQEVR